MAELNNEMRAAVYRELAEECSPSAVRPMSDDIVLGLAEVSLELSVSGREDMASTVESACAEIERLRAALIARRALGTDQ